MDRKEAFSFTAGCYNGEPASCTFACPFRLDLRSFLKKAARGRWDAAYKELRSAVLFPTIACKLCPRPCEDVCQCHTVLGSDPVAIGRIEQACIDYAGKKQEAEYALPPKVGRVAVVGAGPAGLSGALLLAKKQFQITVFDKNGVCGGALRAHPDFGDFSEDILSAFSSVNVKFHYGTDVASLSGLDEFDAVLLATGAGGEHFGLFGTWKEATCATGDARVFLIGEMTGAPLIEGMAQAVSASKSIEAFLLSGRLAILPDTWDKSCRTRFAPHEGETVISGVIPAAVRYTAEEAKAEAGRCLLCDCEACMDACELLVHYKKKPPRISNDVFMDGQSRNSVSSASITRQTWSCNLCGYCGVKCGEGADLRGLFQASRASRVYSGYYPPATHDYWLREMAFATGENSFVAMPPGHLANSSKATRAYAFFPGCRLGASNPAYVTRAAVSLLEKRGAGVLLNCCGAPAYWAGDSEGHQTQMAELTHIWESLGKPVLVTACATCERMLEQFLPEIPYVSLYEMLIDMNGEIADALHGETATEAPRETTAEADTEEVALTSEAALSSAPVFARAAVFDPCGAVGKDTTKQAVRRLALSKGLALSDYDNRGKCCGFGGHMQLANPALYDTITENRAVETEDPYIVYCANCRDVFLSRGKECVHIVDVVYGLAVGCAPTLEEKKENSITVKRELAMIYQKEIDAPERKPWDSLPVTVAPAIREKMERALITLGDVRETIWLAEESGSGFLNEDNDILCSNVKANITYWALYHKETAAEDGVGNTHVGNVAPSRITVKNVYCHRMRVRTT